VEEIFVTLGFVGRGTVRFAEVDIGGMDELDGHVGPAPNNSDLLRDRLHQRGE